MEDIPEEQSREEEEITVTELDNDQQIGDAHDTNNVSIIEIQNKKKDLSYDEIVELEHKAEKFVEESPIVNELVSLQKEIDDLKLKQEKENTSELRRELHAKHKEYKVKLYKRIEDLNKQERRELEEAHTPEITFDDYTHLSNIIKEKFNFQRDRLIFTELTKSNGSLEKKNTREQ